MKKVKKQPKQINGKVPQKRLETGDQDYLEVLNKKKHYSGKSKDVRHLVHIDFIKYIIFITIIVVLAVTGVTSETIAAIAKLFSLGP